MRRPPHRHGRADAGSGRYAPAARTVRTNFGFSGDPGFVFYLEAADLPRYIDRIYGRDKLRAVWSNGGLANTETTLGISREELERTWRASVALIPAEVQWPGWPAYRAQLNKFGCS